MSNSSSEVDKTSYMSSFNFDLENEPIVFNPVENDPDLLDRLLKDNVQHEDKYIDSLIQKCSDLRDILDNDPIVDSLTSSSFSSSSFSKSQDSKDINRAILKENTIEMINWIKSLKDQYVIVKGHIQSGKTNFMICIANLLIYIGFNVVIVLRNNKEDRMQFKNNFDEFQVEHNSNYDQFPLLSSLSKKDTKNINKPRIFLNLGNESNLFKTIYSISCMSKRPYVVIIDEVDAIDSGGKSKKSEALVKLKKNAYCVFGVSGTIMDPIVKEKVQTKNMITLKTPCDYKGIFNNKIQLQSSMFDEFDLEDSKNIFSGKIDDDLFKTCQLEEFLTQYIKMPPFNFLSEYHPRICLINISDCVEPYIIAQKIISKMFPDILTIVYTGEGITVKMGDKSSHRKTSISDVLQEIKNKFNERIKDIRHIIIFAGELAGRGISFKSKDRKWHLTDEFLIVAKKCGEPELIQKIRLAGRYQDDIPLTLFTTKKIISDLRRAYFRQEECIFEAKKEDNKEKVCKDVISNMTFSKNKMTSRPVFKDIKAKIKFNVVYGTDSGLPLSVYDGRELLPESFYSLYKTDVPEEERIKFKEDNKSDDKDDEEEDLAKLIDRINKAMVKKNINSTFYGLIHPDIEYSEQEILSIIKEAGYNQPTSWLKSITNPSNIYTRDGNKPKYGGGFILKSYNGKYKIRDELKVCWIK